MYLNNNVTQSPEMEHQKLAEKRKELIENCKHIRSVFETEFHPHDDDNVESSSYLDMNGARMNRNHGLSPAEEHENGRDKLHVTYAMESNTILLSDLLKEDYIDMSKRSLPENAYDVYETTSNTERDHELCPYTGLPAAHLKIMNSVQFGLLTRIEKKLFFAQTKDFYVGILEKWILLYPSKSNDMKPSECFYPKSFKVEKGENQFSVVTNFLKHYHFQAPNADEFNDWVENIKHIIEENEKTEISSVREIQSSQLSFRKLPSPPTAAHEEGYDSRSSSENYYGFNRNSNQTVINNEERLYEEPHASVRNFEANVEESEIQPPTLPEKLGKKVNDDDEVHSYDVPKKAKAVKEFDERSEIQDNCRLSSSELARASASPDKSRTKVSEMTAILSSINLVSPEEKRKSTHTSNSKKIVTADKTELEKGDKRISPVKNWFSKHISKSKKRLSKREKSPEVEEEENSDQPTSLKGTKVNMIINQLERNGQLKVLSKGLKTRKSLAFSDVEEYETVCVKTKNEL